MRKIFIKSTITGSLDLLHVENGEKTKKGDILCEIQSMKVLYPQESPESGIVHWLVELGDLIQEGQIIAAIDKES